MINRAQAAYYLNGQYSALAAAVGQDVDPQIGYAYDIDSALRALAVAESDLETATVEDSRRDVFYALCEYYAARRKQRHTASAESRSPHRGPEHQDRLRAHVECLL